MADATHTLDPSTVYRDATFSKETAELLRHLHSVLMIGGMTVDLPDECNALADVIQRWDANDATEIVFEDGVAS